MGRYRVTVDTGGTFSDFVYLKEETGEVSISKVPSTPDDPSRAILHGIEMLLAKGVRADDISYFCHGTTVGTNALLEGKGVRTGLLVTEGFSAVYPVGEQARPYGAAIFDVMYDKPSLLVTASATGEVKERVDFRGSVLRELDEAALRQTLRGLKEQKVESIAVCLLFSFLYPQHEKRVVTYAVEARGWDRSRRRGWMARSRPGRRGRCASMTPRRGALAGSHGPITRRPAARRGDGRTSLEGQRAVALGVDRGRRTARRTWAGCAAATPSALASRAVTAVSVSPRRERLGAHEVGRRGRDRRGGTRRRRRSDDHLERGEALLREAPAALLVGQTGEGVHHGVEVGADVQAPVHEVVTGVDDHGERARGERARQAVEQARAADAARETTTAAHAPAHA